MKIKLTLKSHEDKQEPRGEIYDLGGKKLTQVKQFTYLGSIITQAGDCRRDLRTIIARAKDALSDEKDPSV